jgi:hypothetical protein
MDSNSFRVDGDIGTSLINPTARVVILNAIALPGQSRVRVSAKNALSLASFCVAERAMRYLI